MPRHRDEEGAICSRANGVFDAIVKDQDVAGREIHRPWLGPGCEPAAENLDRDLAVHVVFTQVRPFPQRDHRYRDPTLTRPESDLEGEGTSISRIAWMGGIIVTIVTAVVLGIALATATGNMWWHVALRPG